MDFRGWWWGPVLLTVLLTVFPSFRFAGQFLMKRLPRQCLIPRLLGKVKWLNTSMLLFPGPPTPLRRIHLFPAASAKFSQKPVVTKCGLVASHHSTQPLSRSSSMVPSFQINPVITSDTQSKHCSPTIDDVIWGAQKIIPTYPHNNTATQQHNIRT